MVHQRGDEMEFTVEQALAATQGVLVQGAPAGPLRGVSTDSRTVQDGNLFVAIEGERFDGHVFVGKALAAGAGAAVVSTWPLAVESHRPVILVDDTTAAYGDLAAWWASQMPARIVSVTGSNGKTTVKEAIAHLLGLLGPTLCSVGNHNNHIGVPETLLRVRPDHRFAVIEMGTNHPGELGRLARLVVADVAVITNVGPAHLEAFETEQGVAREKRTVLDHLSANGLAVLHADDPWSQWIALRHRGREATFGRSPDATWRACEEWTTDDGIGFELAGSGVRFTVPLHGRHQVANCLAAVAVAAEMGLDSHAAAERLRTLTPPKWRMAVRKVAEATLILDCYNSNPASVRCALEDLAERQAYRRVAVLGDMLELGAASAKAHRAVGGQVAAAGAALLCAVGPEAEALAEAAVAAGLAPEQVLWTTDRRAAARWLCERVGPGDAVLFKASRGVQLEEVAEALEAHLARQCPEPAGAD